jgi:hypothetical protein
VSSAAFLIMALAASGLIVGAPVAGASTSNPFGNESAQTIVHNSVNEANSVGALHVYDQTRSGSTLQTEVGQLSGVASEESLYVGRALSLSVISIGPVAYIKSNQASVLQNTLDLSKSLATSASGKWIGVEQGQAPYSTITDSLSVSNAISGYVPVLDLHVGPARKLGGQMVVPVTGLPKSAEHKGVRGSTTLFVSTRSPHLPIAGTLVLQEGKDKLTEAGTFTKWGSQVSATSPSGALSYAALVGAK